MTEVEKITNQIHKCNEKIKQLEQQRRDICPHDNIKEDHYCDDDYAQFAYKTYITAYKCEDCGLYGSNDSGLYSSKEQSLEYKILKEKYEIRKYGRTFNK